MAGQAILRKLKKYLPSQGNSKEELENFGIDSLQKTKTIINKNYHKIGLQER